MQIIQQSAILTTMITGEKAKGKSIGFVPTMGALHAGHMKLVEKAVEENEVVVVSIFVNPRQFNDPKDLEKYPRTLEKDIEVLKEEKVTYVFTPSESEIYPDADEKRYFDVDGLDELLEGASRPGHFQGMIDVVDRLFRIVMPDKAYFGMKDFQQLLIISKYVEKSKIPLELVPVATVREDDGLAMSSRNTRLSKEERKAALILYDTLKRVKIRAGYQTVDDMKYEVERKFARNKLVDLEYFEIVNVHDLQPLRTWVQSNQIIALIAAKVGEVRLIDNMVLFV